MTLKLSAILISIYIEENEISIFFRFFFFTKINLSQIRVLRP